MSIQSQVYSDVILTRHVGKSRFQSPCYSPRLHFIGCKGRGLSTGFCRLDDPGVSDMAGMAIVAAYFVVLGIAISFQDAGWSKQ